MVRCGGVQSQGFLCSFAHVGCCLSSALLRISEGFVIVGLNNHSGIGAHGLCQSD